jgi:hypothetical protein
VPIVLASIVAALVVALPAPARAAGEGWAHGLRGEVLSLALRALDCGRRRGLVDGALLTVIDYSLPSTARRLWVLDVEGRRVLFRELVAHGRGSGEHVARSFSNRPASLQSSLGLFRTGDPYAGQHGRSLRLLGLELGVNDRAYERAIVLHGADYATEEFARRHGRLGRSWGCPAVDPAVTLPLIDRIAGGSALFVFYPEPRWLATSSFLRCDEGAAAPASASGAPRDGREPS